MTVVPGHRPPHLSRTVIDDPLLTFFARFGRPPLRCLSPSIPSPARRLRLNDRASPSLRPNSRTLFFYRPPPLDIFRSHPP